MGTIGICLGVVVVLVMVAAYWMRRRKPQMAGYGLQRMCPSCGLITPRANVACVECGKVMAAGR